MTLDEIVSGVNGSKRYVFIAEYGVGKSMLLREVYYRLREEYLQKKTLRFPVFINLRDHMGQKDAVELIERHARSIGLREPSQLVRAWRAGYINLLVDGFDELGTRGWVGDAKRFRDLRRATHKVIWSLLRKTPSKSGFVVSGRLGYFDSVDEMKDVLGLGDKFNIHYLQQFNEMQVKIFLKKIDMIKLFQPGCPRALCYWAIC